MTRLRRFARLSFRDQALVVGTVLQLGLTQAALALLPWRGVRGAVRALSRLSPAASAGEARIVWAVRAASSALPFTTCFARALTMQSLLARAGLDATIVVGVAREPGGELVSHAWVERNQTPLLDAADELRAFTRVPADEFFQSFAR